MTIFHLIRHGETDWNMSGRWQGHADIPLNEIGYTQAARLAHRLRETGARFDAIYSSDLQRAWETARAVGTALNMELRPIPTLREIDVGSWSGLTRAEVIERDPEVYARMESGEDVPRGGGERFVDLYNRVVSAVERLIDAHPDQTLALVTHGGVIRALLLHGARDKPDHGVHRIPIGNTSISVLLATPAGWNLGALNDMAHLETPYEDINLVSTPPDDAAQP